MDFSLRRAAAGLIGAAAVQVVVCVAVAHEAYPWHFMAFVFPAFLAAVLVCLAGMIVSAATTAWVSGACLAGAVFSLAASVGVAGTYTGAANVAEPVVGLGVFGAGMSPGPLARSSAVLLVAVHRGGLVVADTGTAAEHAGYAALELGALTAAIAGSGVLRRLARPLDRAAEDLARAAELDALDSARDDERRERGRMLHDGALLSLSMIGQSVVTDSARVRDRCRRDAMLLRGHAATWRVPTLSLKEAIDAVPERFGRDGLTVTVEQPANATYPTDRRVVSALTRALDEALTNVVRHSGVDRAVVRTATSAGTVTLVVADDGRGFDPKLVPADRLGLRGSIGRRLADVGGSVTVRTELGGGSTITLRWPA